MTPNQKKKAQEIDAKVRAACRRERKSIETEKCYCGWTRRYIKFLYAAKPAGSSEDKVSAFLETLNKKSAATQRQALNALVYLYVKGLSQPLGELPAWTRATRKKRIPNCLSEAECVHILDHMDGMPELIARLLFGSGLRLKEAIKLRIKDVDLSSRTVVIRGGKGDKDRTTILPECLVFPIQSQIENARRLWQEDRRNQVEPVPLPCNLENKFPKGGLEFPWFWLFPAASLVRSSVVPIRWHLHPDTLSKAIKVARRKSGITKRVTAHTFRHSFATAYLRNGGTIHELQELLGHTKLETTSIYLTCEPNMLGRIESPLDRAVKNGTKNLVPFAPEHPPAFRAAG